MTTIVIDMAVRELCAKPYYNHKKGCPNYGKRSSCPPKAPSLFKLIDPNEPIKIVYNIFDFGAHCKKMEKKHPEWSERQVACCLYWQGTARKQLKEKVNKSLKGWKGATPVYCPEAMGVNVTATMALIGEKLEWPPITKTYQVALVGVLQRNRKSR